MGGGKKGSTNRPSVADEDQGQDSALTTVINAYDRRMMELQSTLLSNQERRLSELKAEYDGVIKKLQTEISDLRSEVIDLQSSLDFYHGEIQDIKEVKNAHSTTEQDTATVKRLTDIEKNHKKLELQVDYIENQTCRNNVRID